MLQADANTIIEEIFALYGATQEQKEEVRRQVEADQLLALEDVSFRQVLHNILRAVIKI